MKRVFLGDTGLEVSELAMGTQTFGWGADQGTAHAMADRFVEAGGILFDTSSTYNGGASEAMLGSWLKARGARHAAVVATKVFFPTGEGPNESGLSRKHVLRTAEDSLRRLQTDYVDLYQAHCFDASTPLEETLRAFDELVRAGKVRYVGVSNFTASQLVRARCLPVCEQEGLALLAGSPLAGGGLAGKYRQGQAPEPLSRVGRQDRWDDLPEQRESEQAWRVIDRLREVAAARGKTCAQVAINFLRRRSPRVIPIFGARTPEQLEQNLGAVGWELNGEEVGLLEKASATPLPYPYRVIQRYTRRREA